MRNRSLKSVTPSRLRAWRLEQGLTLSEVADLTGFTVAMLSLVETGKRSFSRQGKIRLARRLKVPLRALFDVEQIDQLEQLLSGRSGTGF